MTLGQPRGPLLIGRAFDVSVPVSLDAPDAEGACGSAEVFYGDARVISAPEVRWVPGPNGRDGMLRITSSAPVNEPSVTLNLRVGCGGSFASRRYVLLPEVPQGADVASVFPGQRPPVVAAAPARREPVVASPAPAPAPAPAAAAPRPRPPVAAAPAAAPRPARSDSRAQARPSPAPAPAPSVASRLRLAPLERGPERDAILHFSTELTLPAAPGDAAQRAAAAALWQALNKTPEEAVQEGLRLQALDREIQSLRQVTQQNADAVKTMREQVQAASSDRGQVSWLVLLLLALVLALAGWLGWRWYQSRRMAGVTRWFEANQQDPGDSLASVPAARAAVLPQTPPPPVAKVAKPGRSGLPPVERHLETAPLDVAAARAAIASFSPAEPAAGDFQHSQGGTVRMVGVRELLDVHDKADFFLSIGQHEQAIAVLEAHIHDQVETSALPWLDLLELYHSLGRRQDFEARRTEFRQRFTAQVPDFDHFDEPTSSLENYSRALSRIVALWPSRRVLEIIEESMFRKPGPAGADTFSLEAYRELVLLYHIAQEVAPPEYSEHVDFDAPEPHSEFSATSLQSLSELDRPELDLDVPLDLDDLAPAPHSQAIGAVPDGTLAWGDPHAADRDPLFIPPASPRLGLDIDLTDGNAPTASLPEPSRELPPLDFDTSAFDPDPAGEPPRRS